MRFLHGFGCATIMRDAEIKESPCGDPYIETLVEFEERTGASGNLYAQRVMFRSFERADIARVSIMRCGSIIGFEGTVDAVAMERAGKIYANPRVTGRIMHVAEVAT